MKSEGKTGWLFLSMHIVSVRMLDSVEEPDIVRFDQK